MTHSKPLNKFDPPETQTEGVIPMAVIAKFSVALNGMTSVKEVFAEQNRN